MIPSRLPHVLVPSKHLFFSEAASPEGGGGAEARQSSGRKTRDMVVQQPDGERAVDISGSGLLRQINGVGW